MAITRRELVERIVPKMVGDARFRTLQGLTLGELGQVVHMVLDARREVGSELNGSADQNSAGRQG